MEAEVELSLNLCLGLRKMEKVTVGRVDVWNKAVESGTYIVWLIERIEFHFHFWRYGIFDNLKNSVDTKYLEMLDKM